jgi:hypothetical protein
VSQNFNQLPKKCYIFNAAGKFNVLNFNQKNENPLLVFGWTKLAQHHSFPTNVEIMFGYYEEGLFAINSFKELDCDRDDLILPFHSRSVMPKLTKVWEIVLSTEEKNSSALVKFVTNLFFYTNVIYFILK